MFSNHNVCIHSVEVMALCVMFYVLSNDKRYLFRILETLDYLCSSYIMSHIVANVVSYPEYFHFLSVIFPAKSANIEFIIMAIICVNCYLSITC